jgi:succinate dehydrogenase/fumarate reductase-like Fe-S protein
MNPAHTPTNPINISINGHTHQVEAGISVVAALAICDKPHTRISVTGMPRSAFCGMGVCQECRITINGQAHQLGCQTRCVDQMQILTGEYA